MDIKTAFLLLSLSSMLCLGQKQYTFNRLLRYQLTQFNTPLTLKQNPSPKKNIVSKKYYLTNNKNNTYFGVITDLDSLRYRLVFKDENGLFFDVNFLKSDFLKSKTLYIDCDYVSYQENPYQHLTKHYDFFKLKDTLLKSKTHARYALKSNKPKNIKRKKLGTLIYVFEKETDFHLPIFENAIAYEEWKKDKSLPNSIYLEKYFVDYYQQLEYKEKLLSIAPLNKTIVIPEACNYTKN